MTKDVQDRQRKLKRLWLALGALVALLVVLLVPPLVSVSHYKSQITHLMAASFGRPVRLSSVSVRLLPRPGFVLTDLTVQEDPAYGAEPVLHANEVTASIRLLSLWRGRLEISKISVDEASLNLVRTPAGRWNLDPLFRTAAEKAGPSAGLHLPYLVATNSRINIKNGAEKLPFSLVNTDLSFWQEKPGNWRIQLRGQPARTDLSLEQADTGVVKLDASLQHASELRQMPVHLDLEWREAQLGQLTRLVIGSDPGWRGDLTGELHLDGTANAAQVKTRLRATGVHRAEFAPAAPLDFDARCGFTYHFSARAIENMTCDSPLGDGHIRLAGDLPGEGGLPHFSVELDRIPVAAGLDALRTVRSDFGPGLLAKGSVSGKITYAESAPENGAQEAAAASPKPGKARVEKTRAVVPAPLTGSFTVDSFELSGDGLSQPIQLPKLELTPAALLPGQQPGKLLSAALAATVAIPAGGAEPLTVISRISLSGYQVTVHGQASVARARELAHVAGMAQATALDSLAGDPVSVLLNAEGPWLSAQKTLFNNTPQAGTQTGPAAATAEAGIPATDTLSGTVTLRNADWKADYLANHVTIAQATLHLDNGEIRWDPVVFSYGPVKGTASLTLPASCDAHEPCQPHFQVQFGDLDADALQQAMLGAQKKGTMLSTLIARLHSSAAPAMPQLEGTVKADSLILGRVTLREPSMTLRILPTGAEITGLDAGLLGGRVHGGGTLHPAGTGQNNPAYSFEGTLEKLSTQAVGQLLGLHWSGGTFDANGKVDLSGFTAKDLAASAKGTVHFDWQHGSIGGATPAQAARFDRWTADAEIANGAATLKQNQMAQGTHKRAVEGAVTFGTPPKATFSAPK
jgi:hypothetical protein